MTGTANHISVQGVHKIFQSGDQDIHALRAIDLEITHGEFVCLLGPSGCGKSTLLNAVAGFSLPSSGTITVDGAAITEPGPDRGMVFQEYALFPWMTVEQNIAFGLQIKGAAKGTILAKVDELHARRDQPAALSEQRQLVESLLTQAPWDCPLILVLRETAVGFLPAPA